MSLLKALFLGALLTFLVSQALHGGGSSGGFLNVETIFVSGHYVAWSWPLFVMGTGLAWGILLIMP